MIANPAVLAGIKMVVMDIDGTLITGPSDTLENVTRQLRRLRFARIRFTVATGRTLAGAHFVIERLLSVRMRMPSMIAYNGAVVAEPADRAVVRRVTIPADVYQKIIDLSIASGLSPLVYTCRQRLDAIPVERVYAQRGLSRYPAIEFNCMPIEWIEDLHGIEGRDVASLLLYGPQELGHLLPALTEVSLDLNVTWSGGQFIEVAARDASKLNALRALAARWKFRIEDVMAIGDNYNDLDMIRNVGFGVAVANAPLEVKAAADYTCEGRAANGVVEALRLLLSAVRIQKLGAPATGPGRES